MGWFENRVVSLNYQLIGTISIENNPCTQAWPVEADRRSYVAENTIISASYNIHDYLCALSDARLVGLSTQNCLFIPVGWHETFKRFLDGSTGSVADVESIVSPRIVITSRSRWNYHLLTCSVLKMVLTCLMQNVGMCLLCKYHQ